MLSRDKVTTLERCRLYSGNYYTFTFKTARKLPYNIKVDGYQKLCDLIYIHAVQWYSTESMMDVRHFILISDKVLYKANFNFFSSERSGSIYF